MWLNLIDGLRGRHQQSNSNRHAELPLQQTIRIVYAEPPSHQRWRFPPWPRLNVRPSVELSLLHIDTLESIVIMRQYIR